MSDRIQAYIEADATRTCMQWVIVRVVESVDVPVNVLALPGVPTVSELAAVGVRRISVGGAFALVSLGAVAIAARELLDAGTYGYWATAGEGAKVARSAFSR